MKLLLSALFALTSISFVALRAPRGAEAQEMPQETPQESGKSEPKRTWPWGTEEETKRINEGLPGVWRLVSVRRSAATYEGDSCGGVMLVTAEHLAMQSRVFAPTGALRDTYIEGFSAGTYRWRYDPTRLKVVIHTAMAVSNFGGDNDWEAPGTQREYEVLLNEDQLTFTRAGEAEFNYIRERPTSQPKPKQPR